MPRWLERSIAALSPKWAATRAAARVALNQAERMEQLSLRPGRTGRLDRDVESRGASGDWINELDRRVTVDKARQLEDENLLAQVLLDGSTEAVIGPGFQVEAQAEGPGGEAYNKEAEQVWTEWCAAKSCDVRQIFSFNQLLGMIHRSRGRDGDVGLALLSNGATRLYESDEISNPDGSKIPTAGMVDGVELDRQGAPRAYHVLDPQGDDPSASDRRLSGERTRIPSEEFIFTAIRRRYSDTRGRSKFSASGWFLEQFDGSVEATSTAIRMAACFGIAFLKEQPPTGYGSAAKAADGSKRKRLLMEPGMTAELGIGEDIKQITPQHPGTNVESFLMLLGRLCSRPFGLPLEVVLLDPSKANYSAWRGALLQAWHTWRCEQDILAAIATTNYNWQMILAMEAGRLEPRADGLRHDWSKPGWQWMDPVVEIQAGMLAVEAGFDTKTAINARLGKNFKKVMATRTNEIQLEKDAKMPLVFSTLSRDPGSAAPGVKPPAGPAPAP